MATITLSDEARERTPPPPIPLGDRMAEIEKWADGAYDPATAAQIKKSLVQYSREKLRSLLSDPGDVAPSALIPREMYPPTRSVEPKPREGTPGASGRLAPPAPQMEEAPVYLEPLTEPLRRKKRTMLTPGLR